LQRKALSWPRLQEGRGEPKACSQSLRSIFQVHVLLALT